jgi:type II secretory pathway component HofQ
VDGSGQEERFAPRRIGPRGEEAAHRYHGARIDLHVKNGDLQEVFRLIADVGKVNIVVAGDVSGTITLDLARVPWDQALDVVAKAKGLALERDGNVIIVRASK